MKKIKTTFGLILLTLLLSISSLNAQPDPPPQDGTAGDEPIGGGGAPIGSGLAILVGFIAAYSGKKAFAAYKKEEEE